MKPTRAVLLDGQVRCLRDLHSLIAGKVNLTEAERAKRLSAGNVKYENTIG